MQILLFNVFLFSPMKQSKTAKYALLPESVLRIILKKITLFIYLLILNYQSITELIWHAKLGV